MNLYSSLLAQADAFSAAGSATGTAKGAAESELAQTIIKSVEIFKDVLISIGVIILFYIIGKLIARRIVKALQEAKGESLYPDMVSLINRFTVIGTLFVGLAVVIQFIFGLDFMQVVGFFGLGISFAFKDLLSNLIAGAVIIIQNRFRIGDFIQIGSDDLKGKIMEIQTRATILKAIDGTEIIVPNSELMVKPVTSFTAHHSRRIDFTIGISFDTDIQKAREIAAGILKKKDHVLQKPDPQVLVSGVGESSVDLSMRFWVDPQDKGKSWIDTKSELIAEVKNAFDEANIEIPFPIRQLQGSVKNVQMSLDEEKALEKEKEMKREKEEERALAEKKEEEEMKKKEKKEEPVGSLQGAIIPEETKEPEGPKEVENKPEGMVVPIKGVEGETKNPESTANETNPKANPEEKPLSS